MTIHTHTHTSTHASCNSSVFNSRQVTDLSRTSSTSYVKVDVADKSAAHKLTLENRRQVVSSHCNCATCCVACKRRVRHVCTLQPIQSIFGRPIGQAYAIGNPSVCLSVCLSVTLVYCGQTA